MPRLQTPPETYRYRLEFWADKARRVHELAVMEDDFARAIEGTFFDAWRCGIFKDYDPPLDRARLEPIFAASRRVSPRLAGFTVVLPTPDGGEHRADYDVRYFASMAKRAGTDLMRTRRLPSGSVLLFNLAAYLDQEEAAPVGGLKIEVETPSVAVPVRPGSLEAFGVTEAWDSPRPDEHRVLIPRHVLGDAVEQAKATPTREVGGVLLGHLRRDEKTGEGFLEITCTVPAEETEATELSVTFTPATWARVREVIEMRGESEIFAGWVHSHPMKLCAECPAPPPSECVVKVLFYSEDDEFLMGLTFARPFMVGLLTAAETRLESALGHLPVRLYGWRNGEIHARGFEVID